MRGQPLVWTHTSSSCQHGYPMPVSTTAVQQVSRSVYTRLGPRPRIPTFCRASGGSDLFSKFANKKYLDEAARRYSVGLENNLKEDTLVALELGAQSIEELSDLQKQYVDKVKEKLAQRAQELKKEDAERRMREAKYLELGKKAYEVGEYPMSVQYLEKAVEDNGEYSVFGGEAQLWLALAYQACGRERECIELYKKIEATHPVKKIRKQAADLRYIIEAPKLELGEDERVKIPLLQTDGSWRNGRKSGYNRYNATGKPKAPAKTSYWDKANNWELPMPAFIPDKWYYRVTLLVLLVGSTVYLNWLYFAQH